MQNIANQRENIRSQITWFAHRYLYCSGNWTANVLVTETAQYSALHCFFDFKQNDEYLLISNTLQFICSILLALAFYFILHIARHSYATLCLSMGVPIETISQTLGYRSISTIQIYADITRTKINEDMTNLAERIEGKYVLSETDSKIWKQYRWNRIFPKRETNENNF